MDSFWPQSLFSKISTLKMHIIASRDVIVLFYWLKRCVRWSFISHKNFRGGYGVACWRKCTCNTYLITKFDKKPENYDMSTCNSFLLSHSFFFSSLHAIVLNFFLEIWNFLLAFRYGISICNRMNFSKNALNYCISLFNEKYRKSD